MSTRFLLIPLVLLSAATGCQLIKSDKRAAVRHGHDAPTYEQIAAVTPPEPTISTADSTEPAIADASVDKLLPADLVVEVAPAVTTEETKTVEPVGGEELPSPPPRKILPAEIAEEIPEVPAEPAAAKEPSEAGLTFVAVEDAEESAGDSEAVPEAGFAAVEDEEEDELGAVEMESLKFVKVEDESDEEELLANAVAVADVPDEETPAAPPAPPAPTVAAEDVELTEESEPAESEVAASEPEPQPPVREIAAPEPAPSAPVAAPSLPSVPRSAQPALPTPRPQFAGVRGAIESIDEEHGQIAVTLPSAVALPNGTRLVLLHKYALGRMAAVVEYEVVAAETGRCIARPVGHSSVMRASVGSSVRVIAR